MKKLLTALICSLFLLFISGCSSNTTTTTTNDTDTTTDTETLSEDIIGKWEVTLTDDTADDNIQTVVVTYTFDKDGDFTEHVALTSSDESENLEETEDEEAIINGTYTVDEDKVTVVTETPEGMTIEEISNEYSEYIVEQLTYLYEVTDFTASVDNDTMTVTIDHNTYDFIKVTE